MPQTAFAPALADNRRRHPLPVLVVVEGLHDIEFLRRISRILAADNSATPDINHLEETGRIAMLPIGGNGPQAWLDRLTPLGSAEFYLFDRELPPETQIRSSAVAQLNASGHRIAFLTAKRSLENYLHSAALLEAGGVRLDIADDTPVAELAARQQFTRKGRDACWDSLPLRARKRLRDRAKRWLNRAAVEQMTPQRLADRDRQGEVCHWLETIGRLVGRAI